MAKTATAEKEAKKTTKKKATVKKAAKTGKKYLVIVESPAKAATIGKFLGNNYKIEASMGHVRDMPKSQMGIDFEHDFEPKYITIRGKGELLGKLRKDAKAADKVYLATDPDREGEAISWHLLHALNLGEEKPISRITFNEITKTAVKKSRTVSHLPAGISAFGMWIKMRYPFSVRISIVPPNVSTRWRILVIPIPVPSPGCTHLPLS